MLPFDLSVSEFLSNVDFYFPVIHSFVLQPLRIYCMTNMLDIFSWFLFFTMKKQYGKEKWSLSANILAENNFILWNSSIFKA
jgi:hypothetical protein